MVDQSHMKTLEAELASLRAQGFNLDFNIHNDQIVCEQTKEVVDPDSLTVVQTFRFEGKSNPDDLSALYALEWKGQKGVLVASFGVYASPVLAKL